MAHDLFWVFGLPYILYSPLNQVLLAQSYQVEGVNNFIYKNIRKNKTVETAKEATLSTKIK